MQQGTLMLHAGARRVGYADLAGIATPAQAGRWHPVSHAALVDEAKRATAAAGLVVKREDYGITAKGARMFGVLDVVPGPGALFPTPRGADDYGLAIGIRNSHDKSLAAGLAFGGRVFVCDNLAFSGEVNVLRKHTRHVLDDLPRLVDEAMRRYPVYAEAQATLYERLKVTEVDDPEVHDVLVTAYRRGIIPTTGIGRVLEYYNVPPHQAFADRTAWSLFNAFTEEAKRVGADNPAAGAGRTIRLTNLFRERYGAAPSVN